jgi:hypothetical protein
MVMSINTFMSDGTVNKDPASPELERGDYFEETRLLEVIAPQRTEYCTSDFCRHLVRLRTETRVQGS